MKCLNMIMMTAILVLGAIYYYKVESKPYTSQKNDTNPFEDGYMLIPNFNATANDNCENKGLFGIQKNTSDFYTFVSHKNYNASKRDISLKICYDIAKETNSSLKLEDFCEGFLYNDFGTPIACQDYQRLVLDQPENDRELIILKVGEIDKVLIWAAIPLNICHIYKLESFLHENIDHVLSMFKEKYNDYNPLNLNGSIAYDEEITIINDENDENFYENNKAFLSGPNSLLNILTQRIRCSDPEVIPENIKNLLDNVKSRNNFCFTFDLKTKNVTDLQNVLLVFAKKEDAKFQMDASIGTLYGMISAYVNDDMAFGERYVNQLILENIEIDGGIDCENLYFSTNSTVLNYENQSNNDTGYTTGATSVSNL